MNDRIHHRGPDDDGTFVSGNVALAMRRLSIIDLATGKQPIANEDGTVHVVFNGEIYNYLELRSELQSRGHELSTRSDTETIVHLYEDYGRQCVRHLRGMFAFALWDERRRRLLLARDRLGIKPLYFYRDAQRLVFGSEIKALLAHPGVAAELDRCLVPELLALGYLTGKATLFRGIESLLPGHTASIGEDGKLDVEEYWNLPDVGLEERRPQSYYVEGYRELLEQCVASHLMSDVPLGVFLSGGLDSSTIAAMTKRLVGGPVETFSVGYEAPESELSYAREVADYLGTVHHEVRIGSEEFFGALPALIWHEDKPLAFPASIPLYYVALLARQHVTVVLSGEGSDETLGGYTRYPISAWNNRFDRVYRRTIPAGMRRMIRSAVAGSNWLDAGVRRHLEHTFLGRDMSNWPAWYFEDFYMAGSAAEQAALLHADLRPHACETLAGSLAYWREATGDSIQRLLYTDIKTYLVDLLMKQDRMSMAASVESRVPFLDHELVEFAMRIPSYHNVRGLAGKRVLKKAVEDLLPRSIIYRRKMGFPTPLRSWLQGPELDRVEPLMLSERCHERGLYDRNALRRMFGDHRNLRRDHTVTIWRLLNLELWCRVFLDDEIPSMRVAAALPGVARAS